MMGVKQYMTLVIAGLLVFKGVETFYFDVFLVEQGLEIYRDLDKNDSKPEWSSDLVECLGWTSNDSSDWQTRLGFPRNYDCSSVIGRFTSGFCMFQFKSTKERVRIMRKKAVPHASWTISYDGFSCDQGIEFHNYKIRAHRFLENPPAKFQPLTSKEEPTRGILFSAAGQYLVELYANVKWLRHINCTLPIEIWFGAGELNQDDEKLKKILEYPLVSVREVEDPSIVGWFVKCYALFHTSFDQVILLDTDSYAVRDPSYVFEMDAFRDTGAIFFKDRLQPGDSHFGVDENSILWELLGLKFVHEFEQESGQMFVDRRRCPRCLNLLMFLARTFDQFLGQWNLVYGDKDLFRLAWQMARHPYYYDVLPPGEAGLRQTDGHYCSGTMVQFDPNGDWLFFHRSVPKFHESTKKEYWKYVLKFTGDDMKTQHRISLDEGPTHFCAWRKLDHPENFQIIPTKGTPIEAMETLLLDFAFEARWMSGHTFTYSNKKSAKGVKTSADKN